MEIKITQRYNENLVEAQKRIEQVIKTAKNKSKVVIFIDPRNDEDGYIERVECIIVDKF